jgi:peptide/nickel transport system ATP-binding protein
MALACRPDILVMDEPTTGLDVTTQKQISTLLRTIVDETQVAALYVSHDLALLAEIADRLVVMYAGEIVEAGPMQTVVGAPRHPYTRALLNAVPSARYRAQTTGIPGTPPSRTVTDKCAFAPRCHRALPACSTQHAELDPVAPDHAVRCMNPEPLGSARVSGGEAAASGVRAAEAAGALLTLDAITCEYRSVGRTTVAANAVSISIAEGETVGIVGESGSGKSTLLRAIVGLHAPSSGTIRLRGEELAGRAIKRPRKTRADIQLVFQNPRSALNPRQTVLEAIARPARLFSDISKAEARQLAGELLDDVRLSQSILSRYPGELSGGQQQRVALARAFATRPSVVLLDEVTSALDVSVQATIVDLIRELGPQHGATVIFVSHDLAVVRSLCERAIVMRNGEICEQGDTETLFRSPSDQYTRALVDAIPELGLVATR